VSSVVLDASAVLAFLQREPGGAVVAEHLSTAVISAVNVAEVASRLSDRGVPDGGAREAISALRLEIAAFDHDLAYASAALRPATRRLGLSLGDRACLALAKRERLPALTADRAWASLDMGVEIRLVRDA
jgi:PIN domain nuclease of toxin-antitoxin system